MKYIIQYILVSILLLLSTFAAWYEGSAIRYYPEEWKNTALFSRVLNGEIINSSEISQLDHFIYAAKFTPLYPTLIILCLSYIIILSGYMLFKNNMKKITIFYLSIGALYIFLGITVSNSSTIGGRYMTMTFVTVGIINLSLVFLSFLSMKKNMS
ncbi:DUF4306 domain-containing protein [Evansella sp. AB-rgal1]|uniref:DUF4306 domain-containing protein n=1 Tax=Evansella sp. AB-rgal1 TaxID=3242696 RepID=UPI00359DEA7C